MDTKRLEKRRLRREILAKRNALTDEERRIASLKLTERLLGHQWFYRAEVILGFISFGSEIDTTEFLQEALRLGKKVYVPRVEGSSMEFYRLLSMEELKEGYKGIREPDGTTEVFDYRAAVRAGTGMLLIMPGVAFDRYRNRLGYGMGFYDRYLQQKPILATYSIGVGFDCQMTGQLPAEDTDIRPYQVLTM